MCIFWVRGHIRSKTEPARRFDVLRQIAIQNDALKQKSWPNR
jgi:hypothetical protein